MAAAYVLLQLAPVIQTEWRGQDGCPEVGPIPACYLVAVCYALMAFAALINPRKLRIAFVIGWAPVFALALAGSVLELMGHDTCPDAPNGVPMCFYSLALATALVPLFWLARGAGSVAQTRPDSSSACRSRLRL